jgi:hypothetical protein
MRTFFYTIAAILFSNMISAQSQQTIGLQSEKTIKGTASTNTNVPAAKESNPNTPLAPLTHFTATFVPSATPDPNIVPAVSNAVEPKKTEPKVDPK